jgi:NADPH-dependent ferric siderophore reductase
MSVSDLGGDGRGQSAPGGGRQRPPRRAVVVRDVERLTPQLTRVVVSGDLQNWKAEIPGGHFKLFVPGGDTGAAGDADGANRTRAVGEAGAAGQQGEELWVIRTYTVRACDPDRGLLTIDFAIHADGPATEWAKRAQVGQELKISGMSRPGYAPGEGSAFTLFIADQSALPAVAAIVEALPAGYQARALIEIPTDAGRLELTTDADLQVEWILEAGAPCEALVGAALEAVAGLAAGPGGPAPGPSEPAVGEVHEYWVGCEAEAMRELRRHLVHDRGVPPSSLYTRAYWKQSVANHPDHDTGDDVD